MLQKANQNLPINSQNTDAERDNIAKVKRAWLSDYQTEKDAFRCDFE